MHCTIIAVVIVIIILYLMCNPQENFTNARCTNHVSPIKSAYKENYKSSNMEYASDCYEKCLDSVQCSYMGMGFDCYNKCFDNLTEKNNDAITLSEPPFNDTILARKH
jgi:hypothetical protein